MIDVVTFLSELENLHFRFCPRTTVVTKLSEKTSAFVREILKKFRFCPKRLTKLSK